MLVLLAATALGCSSISTVRLQSEAVEVAPGLRPIAGIQADAISGYFFFIPIPGVDLDKAVNQLLLVAAKSMGADKIADLRFEITPNHGIWALRRLLGWRSARASGIAVIVTEPAPDDRADEGPEPPAGSPAPPGQTGEAPL